MITLGAPDIWCGPDAHQISGTIAVDNPQNGATILVQLVSQAGLGPVRLIPLSTRTGLISFSFDIPGWIPWVSDWIAVQVTTGWSTAWGQNHPTFRGFREPSNHVAVEWEAGPGSGAVCEIS